MKTGSMGMIDKCRAVLAGTEGEYLYPCPIDELLMDFAGITSEEFTAAVKANPAGKVRRRRAAGVSVDTGGDRVETLKRLGLCDRPVSDM